MPRAGTRASSMRRSVRASASLRLCRTVTGDDDRPTMKRTFTLEEANAAIEELRPVVGRLVEHRRNLAAAQRLQTELLRRIAGNGGDMQPSDIREATASIQSEADAIAVCAEQI